MFPSFCEVFDLDEYQHIQDTFSKNMGVSSITVLPSGKPITLPSNSNRLCEDYIRLSPKGWTNCVKCHVEIGQQNSTGPIIKQCMENKGLWHAGVSIVVGGVYLANWCIGQVKNRMVDEDHMLRFAEEIGADTREFKIALKEIPYMSKERLIQVAQILFLFANQLAEKAHKNLLLKQQIREIKKTHELHFQSEKRYKLLFDKSTDAIFVINLPDGQYLDANEAAEKLTGRTRQELLTLTTKDINQKEASKRLEQIIEDPCQKVFSRVKFVRPDGSVRVANVIALPIDQHSLFGVAQDITEQLKATGALKHSHHLMQYIIEHSRNSIAVHDKDLRYIYVSKRYLEEYGIKGQQIIGKHHYEVFPDLPQKWRDAHQKALQGIVSRQEEDVYEKADGSLEWTRWECRPWYDQHHQIGGIIVYTEVITPRKQMEMTLRESEEKYKFLFYNNPQPSWIYDIESLSFLEVNHAAVLHYGYSREEFLNMTLLNLRPPEDIYLLMDDIINNRDFEYYNNQQWRHLKKNGEVIYVEISSHSIEYQGKQARHVLINDITKRVKTEQELRAAQERAEESDRLKSAFLANMSHEIRTPLNSILGFSELLTDADFNEEEKKEFMEAMKQNSERLLSLINDILEISQIESGQVRLKMTMIPLDDLLHPLLENHLPAAHKKGLELRINTSEIAQDTLIYSDRLRITQILNNLVNNAIKFTQEGDIEVGIRLWDNSFLFFVKDTGIGIPTQFHEQIFERFWQVDRGLSRKFEGSGLGLTIVKILVKSLRGRLWLESAPGLGSTFYFTIPNRG